MKTNARLLIMVGTIGLLLGFSESAYAQGGLKAEGIYITGAIGAAAVKLDLDDINILDDTTLAWKLGAGYRWRHFTTGRGTWSSGTRRRLPLGSRCSIPGRFRAKRCSCCSTLCCRSASG